MANLCNKNGCNNLGTKSCAACKKASYCSVVCQKEDWKTHKRLCAAVEKDVKKDVKKSVGEFLKGCEKDLYSVSDIQEVVLRTCTHAKDLESKNKVREAINVLQSLVAFATFQFGVEVVGTSGYKRLNGEVVDNNVLIYIRVELSKLHEKIGFPDTELANAIETRRLLETRDKSEAPTIPLLFKTERTIATIYIMRKQIDEASPHCEQGLMFAKLMKGEERVAKEYDSLILLAQIRGMQGRNVEAIDLCEDACILVSDAYGPVHPDVQLSISQLINQLIKNKNYKRADDYCRINYENLIDPLFGIDQEGEFLAEGTKQMAEIWLFKDVPSDEKAALSAAEEAETLSRKACRIADKVYGPNSSDVVMYYSVLREILIRRDKYTEETRAILERTLMASKKFCREKPGLFEHEPNHSLELLIRFHARVSDTIPPGDAKNRELKLRDKYMTELAKVMMGN